MNEKYGENGNLISYKDFYGYEEHYGKYH